MIHSTKRQGRRVSTQYHDWLLGEDSALRDFLPPTLSACSPQADAPAAVVNDEPHSPGSVGPDRPAAGAPYTEDSQ